MPVSKKSKKHRSEDNWSLLQVALLVLDEWVDMDSVRQYPIGDTIWILYLDLTMGPYDRAFFQSTKYSWQVLKKSMLV